jgi:large subunit ribosomal protein L10
MNREQKAAAIAEIAENIKESDAVFAVDYRGISVPQANELRSRLRGADARFSIVKNTLTERAADEAGAEALKELLQGPTALTFVRGDAAAAAKALRDYARETELLPFKGGFMDGAALTAEDIGNIARLPVATCSTRSWWRRRLPISGWPDAEPAHRGLAIALGGPGQGLVGRNARGCGRAAGRCPAAESAPAEDRARPDGGRHRADRRDGGGRAEAARSPPASPSRDADRPST